MTSLEPHIFPEEAAAAAAAAPYACMHERMRWEAFERD